MLKANKPSIVKVRLNAEQEARLRAAAAASGLPKATYARSALMRGIRLDPEGPKAEAQGGAR